MANHDHSHDHSHDHHEKNHDFHIIELSPYPALMSLAMFLLAFGIVTSLHGVNLGLAHGSYGLGAVLIITTLVLWWKKVIHEGLVEGEQSFDKNR